MISSLVWVAILVGTVLAWANGANDNFKGVATLYGSRTTSYRVALGWATACTVAGSLAALVLARSLLVSFSGKGLVPAEVARDPAFAAAVALAAALTVTHSLIGGLVGAGVLASPSGVDLVRLQSKFVVPLLVSPVLAVVLAGLLYLPLRFLRRTLGVEQETCVCVGEEVVAVVPGTPGPAQALAVAEIPTVHLGSTPTCRVRYTGRVVGLSARQVLDVAHFLSAGAVSFARGLNDTPKIAALLLVGGALAPSGAILGVGVAMAVGGLLHARRVAETMSMDVTTLNPGQGFTANVVTSFLVIVASRLGVPVSTTHVSCGSLFGIGSITGQAHWRTIGTILLAWVTTLPVAAALAAGITLLLSYT
jgi:PiT family inorganic phosphate transporter